ncbi:DUF308 domain-containing protein [Spirillospora sp. NPDC048823]
MVNEHQAMALTLGGISFLLGVVVVAWPGVTVGALAVLIGLQLIINGVVRIAQSVTGGLTRARPRGVAFRPSPPAGASRGHSTMGLRRSRRTTSRH